MPYQWIETKLGRRFVRVDSLPVETTPEPAPTAEAVADAATEAIEEAAPRSTERPKARALRTEAATGEGIGAGEMAIHPPDGNVAAKVTPRATKKRTTRAKK